MATHIWGAVGGINILLRIKKNEAFSKTWRGKLDRGGGQFPAAVSRIRFRFRTVGPFGVLNESLPKSAALKMKKAMIHWTTAPLKKTEN